VRDRQLSVFIQSVTAFYLERRSSIGLPPGECETNERIVGSAVADTRASGEADVVDRQSVVVV